MENPLGSDFYRSVFDSIPSPLFVVDDDVRIHAFNKAARPLLRTQAGDTILMKGGDALGCINAKEGSHGCGTSEACRGCVVRAAVGTACREKGVVRHPQRMQLESGRGLLEMYYLVTTSAFSGGEVPLAILILEDIGGLVSDQGLVHVCMHCRRVRDGSQQWGSMERYLKEHLDMGLSHGVCPQCLRKYYPEAAGPNPGI